MATGIIKDTLTGLVCTSYNTTLSLCQWGSSSPVEFPLLENAVAAADDMNVQNGGGHRFIGQNPHPR